jgi:hypothetical protein
MLWQVVLKHFKSPIASVNIRQPQKACHRFLGFVMTRSCKRVGVQACKCAKVRSYKRRVQLLSIIGSAGTLPSRKFAVSLFANRYSLFATRCRSDAPKFFGSAGGRISLCAENFRQCGSTALQKTIRYSLLVVHHSPVANRQSPIAAISRLADLPISRFADKFGSAGASPSQLVHRLKSVSTKNEAC